MCAFEAMTRRLDPKCLDFGRKAIISQVGHCLEYCSVLPAFFNMFFSINEVANACIGEWKQWHAAIEKWTLRLLLLCLFMFPNIFMGSTSINKQMLAKESGSCGVEDCKNKYYIYSCFVCSCSQIYFWAAPL